ncbi:MAG: dipeptide transport system permease protein DppB [Frankiales bacterium]|nr:dipeptide transport system permease protein DppB [Frankiales bacterium]
MHLPPLLRRVLLRLAGSVPLLVLLAFAVFAFLDLAPGDIAVRIAGETASAADVDRIRRSLGLDEPLLSRFGNWLADAVRGDLGTSLSSGEQVSDMLASRIPVTLSLLLVSLSIAIVVGFAAGLVAALRSGSFLDRLLSTLSAVSIAAPPFWIGLVLAYVFAIQLSWFPAVGYAPFADGPVEWLRTLLLPAIALAAIPAAEVMRQLRGSLQDVLATDYVLAARAKGLRTTALVGKHGLKNAAIPVVTVLGFRVAQVIGSTVVVESVFNIQGIGSLLVRAVLQRDIPVVLGVTLMTTIFVVVVNLLVDLSYGYFSPRSLVQS